MLRNGWSAWHFVGATVITCFAIAMTFPAWRNIYQAAVDPDGKARHIFLIPVVAAWLVWVRRRRIFHCRPHGHWAGLVMIVLGGLTFALASQAIANNTADQPPPDRWIMLWHVGAVIITLGCAFTMLGLGVLRRYLPAAVVLLMLVPLPASVCNQIEFPVKVITLELTVEIYDLLGIDASLDYETAEAFQPPHLILNETRSAGEDLYHGLPMVFDLLLVSWAFVFGSPLRPSVRLIILLLSPVSAILCGAAGLIATLWLYGQPGWDVRADVFHQIAAWTMLIVAFLLLAGVIRLLNWASVPVRHYTLAYDL